MGACTLGSVGEQSGAGPSSQRSHLQELIPTATILHGRLWRVCGTRWEAVQLKLQTNDNVRGLLTNSFTLSKSVFYLQLSLLPESVQVAGGSIFDLLNTLTLGFRKQFGDAQQQGDFRLGMIWMI